MDGVIYHGNRLLPGVKEFVDWLYREEKQFLFLTNSSYRSPKELQKKLERMGLEIGEEHFYTSALATAKFIQSQSPGCSAYVIGDHGLYNALHDAGITINDVDSEYVVVGETEGYRYEHIMKAMNLVNQGAKFIATNTDITGPVEGGIAPACRAFVALIEATTGKKAYYIGKPNPLMMRTGLQMLGVHLTETAMIGDRMDTDIVAGIESGMDPILVLSGVSTRETINLFPVIGKVNFFIWKYCKHSHEMLHFNGMIVLNHSREFICRVLASDIDRGRLIEALVKEYDVDASGIASDVDSFLRKTMKYKERLIRMVKSPALRDICRWSRESHLSIIYICILNFIVAGGALVITVATRGVIDGAIGHNRKLMLDNAILMCAAFLTVRICTLLSALIQTQAGANLLRNLRAMLLKQIFYKKYAGLGGIHSGELVNRMFSDVSVIKNGIVEIVPALVSMTVSFIGATVILIRIDWRFVVVLIIGGMFGLAFLLVFNKPMKDRHKRMQRAEGKLYAICQESLENLRLIKASGSEMRMEKQVSIRQNEYLETQLCKGYFAAYLSNGVNAIFQIGWLFCMLWGCIGIYEGRLTYGMLAAIIQLVVQIQTPIANAASVVSQIYGTVSSAERLKEILDLPEEKVPIRIDGRKQSSGLKEIRMCDMDFSYGRGAELVLNRVNVNIKQGDFVAVTGSSGEGKSTLFQLLLGIYQPINGSLKFCYQNGEEEEASGRTRTLFAYVPQGNTLFSGTLRENISMFTDEVTEEEIWEAVKAACIDRFIAELEEGLDTVIGERGLGLSEGQAQRVAVARALLTKAPILLLDESTSALDEAMEAKLLKNIAGMKDKTCLIVTHRKAALRICDYRIHIENAKVSIINRYEKEYEFQ